MASDGQLKEWVSDKLMTLLGYSKSVVVQYVIRLGLVCVYPAKECSSTGDLVGKLVEFGFTSSAETRSFAADIYAKVPRRASGINNYQKQEREAAQLVRKQSTYKLLADDDDNDADNQTSTSRQSSANQSSKSRKHFRKKAEDQDAGDDDNDEKMAKDSGRNVRRRTEEEDEEDGQASSDDEQERIRDQQERAQLERNMKERDAANTRKLMERQLSKEEQEELHIRSQAMEKNDTSNLRKYSRQAYLQKRRDKKIEEIRDEILDHEYIFQDVKLTEAEEKEFRYKKKIYDLVKDHVKSDEGVGEYKMPDAYDIGENVNQEKRFSVALQRYKDPDAKDKMNPFAEQEAWEEHQIGKSKLQFGSKDRKQSSDDYQYVFEDSIDFVKSSVIEGTQDDNDLDEEDVDAKDMLKRELQDQRKTLPIYKFRDELLKAVDQFQIMMYVTQYSCLLNILGIHFIYLQDHVIVIVGETGSGKTTQIPQYLHEAGYTAKGKVGYSISVVMVDEAHERTLSTDILFGLVKDISRFRPDLKLLISSATLDAEKFSDYFDSAPIFKIPGRRYPVEIHYTKAPEADYIDAAIVTVLQIHVTQSPGDILAFVRSNHTIPALEWNLCLLTLSQKHQQTREQDDLDGRGQENAFAYTQSYNYMHDLEDNTVPEIQRTNLANVVLTLKSLGIHDLVNFDFMDPPPSEALLKALEQLFALSALNSRGELTKTGRRMAEFPLDPMLSKMIVASEKYKCSDEIISIASMLSIGNSIFYRPKDKQVHADNARLNFHTGNVGDHIALLNVYNSWKETDFSTQWCYENYIQVRSMKRARDIRDQLEGLLERVEIEVCSNAGDLDAIKKAITSGFFHHSARLQRDGTYKTVKNPQTVHIHPSSGLAEASLLDCASTPFLHSCQQSSTAICSVTELKPEWLVEIAPHYYQLKDVDDSGTKKLPKGKGRAAL
ncbi:hypothetical protein PR202_ga31135 [Eleusine coracana subsp. coracana]|uniref:RNA helicase n=1 Tax=Eleusine coracana subsp. coracana TaxID=191504 RepID=A0AAV5DRE5_ELECO|nr:hypothetical protein PR202_ga31135 [Eleusine coracana subsp. coracana]